MRSPAPTRFIAAVSLACGSLLFSPMVAQAQTKPSAVAQAASSLPANQPTMQPRPSRIATQQEPRHAEVAYTGGMLFVSADDSSLNQILRQISHETGMKITGGVTDERVFGKYGPSAPSQVLATLLDGTGSNMLLLHRDGSTPAELVLTPRTGGATPPNPNAAVFDEHPESEEVREPVEGRDSTPMEPNPNAPAAISSSNPAAPSIDAQPESPNGVKTPQQIFDQLQRMRQQQQPSTQ